MIPLINKPDVHGSDSEYPYGDVRDQSMTEVGTPLNAETHGDFHQFFEKMMAESGITANNLRDNEYNGWQLWEALRKAIQTQQEFIRYHVKLNQTGTSAPTLVYQAENDTSSSPSWAYTAVGRYRATFGSAVFSDVTKCMKYAEPLRLGASIYLSFPANNILEVATYDVTGTLANDILVNSDIYIDIYP